MAVHRRRSSGGSRSAVRIDGPLFDGRAGAAASDYTDMIAREVAAIGRDWIRIEAHGMDKSGRATGAAAHGVEVQGRGRDYVIRGGIQPGEYSWPWLEGITKRNQSTGFRGYRAFRRTRLRLKRTIPAYAQELMDTFVGRMGGA